MDANSHESARDEIRVDSCAFVVTNYEATETILRFLAVTASRLTNSCESYPPASQAVTCFHGFAAGDEARHAQSQWLNASRIGHPIRNRTRQNRTPFFNHEWTQIHTNLRAMKFVLIRVHSWFQTTRRFTDCTCRSERHSFDRMNMIDKMMVAQDIIFIL